MPIRINLLAEEIAAEEMRRKDPVKRAIWIGSFVVFLVLLWGLTLFLQSIIARSELAGLREKWKSMEQAAHQVDENRRLIKVVEEKLSALAQFTTNRFLWANALDAFQHTCVDNVQLLRLKAEQVYVQPEATAKLPTNSVMAAAMAIASAKPGGALERIVVTLDARDYSPRAAEQVPRYKEALSSFPFFQAHLQKTNAILLTSLSAPQTDPQRKANFVVFGLQLNFQDKERRLYE